MIFLICDSSFYLCAVFIFYQIFTQNRFKQNIIVVLSKQKGDKYELKNEQ